MTEATGVRVQNWEGSIVSFPSAVVEPESVDEIIEILKDTDKYPSPIRAIGSNHSTTRCGVADKGTVMLMGNMDRIVEIGTDFVTAQAGALYIDVAKELEKRELQFYVNVELGNLTIGSACCGGTKDASMPDDEFGQVCSYATSIKLVKPSGELIEVTEADHDELQIMRSSYGLLGVVYEATFKVKPLQRMSVHHTTYSLDRFHRELPSLWARGESMMLYLYPFLNSITVEYRKYHEREGKANHRAWALRNWVWKTLAPGLGTYATKLIPIKFLRYFIINVFNRIIQLALKIIVSSDHTVPTDQLIRYPHVAGKIKYTFSIWAFPEDKYSDILRAYFEFCKKHYKDTGYRCDLLNVGYRIYKDQSSLFSYSYDGNVMTLDPVSTGGAAWEDFLKAYNDFCSDHGGVPLFNQTKWITPEQARKAFPVRLDIFKAKQKEYDPTNRLLNDYFSSQLGPDILPDG